MGNSARFLSDDAAWLSKWREDLKKFHARHAGEILRDLGYGDDIIERVQSLKPEEEFPRTTRTAGSSKTRSAWCSSNTSWPTSPTRLPRTRVIVALQKSWQKMTPAAHAEA